MTNDAYIVTDALTMVYHKGGEEIRAVDSVNLKIQRGEFTAIWGTSGAGKSTLLYLIGGLGRPTGGRVIIGDDDITVLNDEALANFRREHIGFIFQFFYLLPSLTVLENVMVPLMPLPMTSRERYEKAVEVIERVGLAHRIHHLPGELSGGEQQRVAIARAIVNNPELILADEPTSDLDRKTAEAIVGLLQELNQQGCTVVIATHDMRILDRARRRIGMEDGKIVSDER